MRVPTTALATMILALLTTAAPSLAFDLTGHWVGKYSCKGFAAPFDDDGKLVNKFSTSHSTSTLDITQTGNTFAAVVDRNTSDEYRYNGFTMPSAKKDTVGEVFLLGCSNDNVPAPPATGTEIMRIKVSTKTGATKASFKGFSLFADNYPEIETCKYSYTRVDTTTPTVDACP